MFKQGRSFEAVAPYESLLKDHPQFIRQFFRWKGNRELHEAMARHSILLQGYNSGGHKGKGYTVDLSLYLDHHLTIKISGDLADKISDFKTGSDQWGEQVDEAFRACSSTLLKEHHSKDTVDWSPLYLARWVLNDYF